MLAQSSTLSTPTNNVIVIGGQKFVLVPEKAFVKIEKMVDELPALRTENSSLKAKDANSQAIIDRDTQIIALKDQVITSTETARLAETKRADAEKDRAEALQKGLDISEADRTKLQAQVKKYRRYAVIGAIATIATYILLR